MSSVPTPAQAAAARQKKLAAIAALKARCLTAIELYDGNDCVAIPVSADERQHVSAVEAEMPGWSLYASTDGMLYLGEALQTGLIRTRDSLLGGSTSQAHTAAPAVLSAPTTPGDTAPGVVDSPAPVTAAPPQTVAVASPPSAVVDVPAEVVPAPRPVSGAKVTFGVADVRPNTERLIVTGTRDILTKLLQGDVEACSNPSGKLVDGYGFHGLIEVAHRAYEEHYGLVLSADDIWVTVAQGFANLVNREPEVFRGKFVSHAGKQEIRIRRDHFVKGNPDNDWQGCFGDFSDAIRGYIGDQKHAIFVADFSTTGALQKAISEVVLMDTVQAYFEYVVETRCGIPSVTLRGDVSDWRRLAQKVRDLEQFGDLGWWLNELHPIMDEFVNAASGKVNRTFWDDLYKGKDGSGGYSMSGWILKLLPLVKPYGQWKRNPLLGTPNDSAGRGRGYRSNVNNADLPASLSTVPFIWDYLGTRFDYQFIGGILGYSQSEDGAQLQPEMGWAVRPKPTESQPRRRGSW